MGRLVSGLTFCVSGLLWVNTALAQVVPDGSTATSVNINANGSVTVGIAPPSRDGVSLNNYDKFNVGKPGVNLDNRREAARTIVNEVTGTSQSEINGPVEVLGQTAHVIIANPNGVSVDGGSFINTGRTVLTTGDISLNAREIAPGIFQENVVSTTSRGTIHIKGGGLAGQMDAVDLIAHQVRVDGTVTNSNSNPEAGATIVAGASRAEFDSSVIPGNLDKPWESVTSGGASSNGAVLVEITRPGAIRANKVEIQVTDKGAGARIAGVGHATSRDFVLRADGQIDLNGAKIDAAQNITITGGGVKLNKVAANADKGRLAITAKERGLAGSDVVLSADEMSLISDADIVFRGQQPGGSQFRTDNGNITVSAAGAFSDQNGQWDSAESIVMNGKSSVALNFSTITAARSFLSQTDGAVTATDTQITAAEHVLITADEAAFSSVARQGKVVAENGGFILTTLGVNSSGDLINKGTELQGGQNVEGLKNQAGTLSDGAVTLNVKGDVRNLTEGENLAVIFGAAGDVALRSDKTVENKAGRLVANGDVRVVAAGDVLNLVDLPNGTNTPKITEYTQKGKRKWWTLGLKRKKRTFVEYDYGTLENPDNLSFITASGSIAIQSGGRLLNQGGEINANGGDVDLSAITIETIGVGSGRAYVERVCVLTCKYKGEGNIDVFGGKINAAKDVRLVALKSVRNQGGEIVGLNDVSIKTPSASFEALLIPTVVNRPSGLYNFWASDAAWMYLRDRFGGVIADAGNIIFDTENPVEVLGASLDAGGEVVSEAGVDIVRTPRVISPVLGHEIGLVHKIPPVSFE